MPLHLHTKAHCKMENGRKLNSMPDQTKHISYGGAACEPCLACALKAAAANDFADQAGSEPVKHPQLSPIEWCLL